MTREFNSIQEFLQETSQKEKKQFNFFRQMYNFSNERYLHSSFIAMLLSQENNAFLQLFLEELNETEAYREVRTPDIKGLFPNGFLEVHPNRKEGEHNEEHNIDILIKCEKTRSVIIIENKTFSGDRTKDGKPQLVRYAETFKGYNVFLAYLTLRGIPPQDYDMYWETYPVRCIGYDRFLMTWIAHCIEECPSDTDPTLKTLMSQYLQFLKENLDTEDNANTLIGLIAHSRDEAYDIYCDKNGNEHFQEIMKECMKDVKWHTVYSLLRGTLEQLNRDSKIEFLHDYERELLEYCNAVRNANKARCCFITTFKYEDRIEYFCADQYGISIGNCTSSDATREAGRDYVFLHEGNLSDFKNINNFNLIGRDNMNLLQSDSLQGKIKDITRLEEPLRSTIKRFL